MPFLNKMYSTSSLYIFYTFVPLIRILSAFPISLPAEKRQTDICTDGRYGVDSSCWTKLNLTSYLTHWNETTPSGCDDPACCRSTESWSQCFIRLAGNGTDQDNCSQIGGCVSSDPTSLPVDASVAHEVRYIVLNIYCEFLSVFL